MRQGDDHGVGLPQCLVQLGGAVDRIEERVVRAVLRLVASDGDNAHVEAARRLGDTAREIAGADDRDRPPRNLLAAIAHPALRLLLGVEMAKAAEMQKKRHHDELGERPRMDAARRGNDDVALLKPQLLDALSDAG